MSSNIVIEASEPRQAGTAISVAAVVHACHEKTIGPGLAELGIPGLDRAAVEPVLVYCAERRCEADDATCPGCRLRTQRLGVQSFDALSPDMGKSTSPNRLSVCWDRPERSRRRAWSISPRPGRARSTGIGHAG